MSLEETTAVQPATDKRYIEIFTTELRNVSDRLGKVEKMLLPVISLGVEMDHAKTALVKQEEVCNVRSKELFDRLRPIEAVCAACANKHQVQPHWWAVGISAIMLIAAILMHWHLMSVVERVLSK